MIDGTYLIEYSSNNSGGVWWLNDEQWKKLEKAGWRVAWCWLVPQYTEDGMDHILDNDGLPVFAPNDGTNGNKWMPTEEGSRWLDALATRAYTRAPTLGHAIREWTKITGMNPSDEGCPCCGPPHSFMIEDRDAPETAWEETYVSGEECKQHMDYGIIANIRKWFANKRRPTWGPTRDPRWLWLNEEK